MCGLTGIFHPARQADGTGGWSVDEALLRRMTRAISHRGPDAEGFHVEPGLGFGFRRLAIIDIAGGNQPMFNEDGSVVIVFNGEIYNFHSLRQELEAAGHVFRNHCDTETIVHAWETWGVDCLDHLSGMFSFALWDRNRRQLFLARDRLGKKPLYYGTAPGGAFVFASELCALAEVEGLLGEIDLAAMDDFFSFGYIPDPGSIYAGIKKLPAAHYMLIDQDRGIDEPQRYWGLDVATASNAADAAGMLRERLRDAVAARMIADVPLGAFLSGGVDSSSIVALAAGLHGDALQTFTIGFPGDEDERGPAALVARRYATAHHTGLASPADIIAAARAQARIFGEPFGDLSSVPTFDVAALARRHVTVALSGDGGDEVFGGYRRYQWHLLTEGIRRYIPAPLRRHVIGGLARVYPKLDFAPRWLRAKYTLTELSLDAALGYYRMVCKVHDQRRQALFSRQVRTTLDGYDASKRISTLMASFDDADPLRQAQAVDIATYLPGDILTKVDRTSMANGLEVRCPILDHDLVAWGLGLPATLKRRGTDGKRVLKQAMAPLLPAEILDRPKQGFSVSLGDALRRSTQSLKSQILSPVMLDSGLFEEKALAGLIAEHAKGSDHSQALWLLLVFEGFLSHRADMRAAGGAGDAALAGAVAGA